MSSYATTVQQQQQNNENSQADVSNKICTVKFETIFFKKYLLKHVKNLTGVILPNCDQ